MTEAGVDVERAQSDLAAHQEAIEEILARNNFQAMDLGFQGPPSFIIGHFRVPGAIDSSNLKSTIAEARAAAQNR